MPPQAIESFAAEIAQLRELQRQAELRRANEEQEKKREREEAAKRQEEAMARLLSLQVEEAEERKKRAKLWNSLLAVAVSLLSAIAAGGVYVGTRHQDSAVTPEDVTKMTEDMRQAATEVERRVTSTEKKLLKLRDVAMEQQVQIADSTEYLAEMISAIAPKSAAKVDTPTSVKKARAKADAIRARRDLFTDDGDPFADL